MRFWLSLAAAGLIPLAAMAQDNKPATSTLDQQVEQAQSRLAAAQIEYYSAVARKFQADLVEARKREADTAAWWAAWWKGTFPQAAEK